MEHAVTTIISIDACLHGPEFAVMQAKGTKKIALRTGFRNIMAFLLPKPIHLEVLQKYGAHFIAAREQEVLALQEAKDEAAEVVLEDCLMPHFSDDDY